MDKMQVRFKREKDSTIFVDVEWKEKSFEDVEIERPKNCTNSEEYVETKGRLRPKSSERNAVIFNCVSGGIMSFVILICLRKLKAETVETNNFAVLALILAFFLVADIVCTIVEEIASKVTVMVFESKIKKAIKNLIQDQEKEEKRKQAEVFNKDASYKSISDAEVLVGKFEELTGRIDLGKNSEKTTKCISMLRDIIEQLKDNGSKYARVAVLFEAYLPELYSMFSYYSEFVKAEVADEEKEEILSESLDKFSELLESKKIEVRLDRKDSETQFAATAKALNELISKEGKK